MSWRRLQGSAWALDTLALISYRNWVVPSRVPGETLPANLTQEWVVPASFRPDPVSGHVIPATSTKPTSGESATTSWG